MKDSMTNEMKARAITRSPGFHWFGYYDKWQFDPSDRYVLGMRVDFEHRLPDADDAVAIGMIDLAQGNRWIDLGQSRAWSWQQGCMLQWRPGSAEEILFNDREGERYVCRVLNVRTRHVRTLPQAIGTVSPCGRFALCEDYRRIWNFRAGYGYAGIADPHAAETAPSTIGVWRMDLETGAHDLIVSVADLARIPYPGQAAGQLHYVNHLAYNPTGDRFLMFNRWSGDNHPTRVFTAAADGSDLRLLSAHGASHWTWRDPEHVLIWGEGAYRLYRDNGLGEPVATVWEHPNGHQSYIPGTDNEWLLTDTYPRGTPERQELCLYHIPTRRKVLLAQLEAPPPEGECQWRCDLHPRLNRRATQVVVDSEHTAAGRQMYLFDIEDILNP